MEDFYVKKGILERCVSEEETVTVPIGVTRIGAEAFLNCAGVKRITLPDTVTRIEDGAFSGCSALASVNIPKSVTEIGSNAFSKCVSLEALTVPDSVRTIGDGAFKSVPESSCIHIDLKFVKQLEAPESKGAWAGAIRGYLTRYYLNKTDEAEDASWGEYLKQRNESALKLLPKEPLLYRYLTDMGAITYQRAEKLLDKAAGSDCKAILLDYANKRKKKERSADEVIDKLFSLDGR